MIILICKFTQNPRIIYGCVNFIVDTRFIASEGKYIEKYDFFQLANGLVGKFIE